MVIDKVSPDFNLSTGYIMIALIVVASLVIGCILLHHRVTRKGQPLPRDTKSFLIAYSIGLLTAYVVLLFIHFLSRIL